MRIFKTPAILKFLLPKYVWSLKTNEKILYLTFDDGPTPQVTPEVLEILQHYNAKATFFCIGKNAKAHPQIVDQLIAEGHAVGNHTHDHLNGWNVDTQHYIKNTQKAATSLDTKLFRPPYGRIQSKQAKQLRKLGFHIVMWDVLSYDWEAHISKERVLKNVISKSGPGSIIVFHDSAKAATNMLYSLPKLLAYFTEKGYEFRKLDVLLHEAD